MEDTCILDKGTGGRHVETQFTPKLGCVVVTLQERLTSL
jgi:hypothetical protein